MQDFTSAVLAAKAELKELVAAKPLLHRKALEAANEEVNLGVEASNGRITRARARADDAAAAFDAAFAALSAAAEEVFLAYYIDRLDSEAEARAASCLAYARIMSAEVAEEGQAAPRLGLGYFHPETLRPGTAEAFTAAALAVCATAAAAADSAEAEFLEVLDFESSIVDIFIEAAKDRVTLAVDDLNARIARAAADLCAAVNAAVSAINREMSDAYDSDMLSSSAPVRLQSAAKDHDQGSAELKTQPKAAEKTCICPEYPIAISSYTSLQTAAENGCTYCVRQLLSLGNDVGEAVEGSFTPLCLAILNGHTDCVCILLVCGADVNQCSLGETPMQVAMKAGNLPIVQMLMEHGAHKEVDADKDKKHKQFTVLSVPEVSVSLGIVADDTDAAK